MEDMVLKEKLIINASLEKTTSDFNVRQCIVEKAIPIVHSDFEELKKYPIKDNKLIAQYMDKMYCDSNNNYHCLLLFDYEQGDGLLIESEGNTFAKYAQYVSNAKLLYTDFIRSHTKEIKLYCPLIVKGELSSLYNGDDQFELSDDDVLRCKKDIEENLSKERDFFGERGLMEYFSGDAETDLSVFSVFPFTEVKNNELMGVFVCKVSNDITETQLQQLKDYITGQASDGWGESYEQHPIRTSRYDKIYVSFWNNDNDWDLTFDGNIGNCLDCSEDMKLYI